jgi:hypothetical protein
MTHSRAAGSRRSDAQGGASFGQVKMPPLLALHAGDRAIGGFFVGVAVQRHPDGEAARRVLTNDLNTAYRLASWPPANGFKLAPARPRIFKNRPHWSRGIYWHLRRANPNRLCAGAPPSA